MRAALSEALATSDLRLDPARARVGARRHARRGQRPRGADLLRRRGRGLTRRLSRSEPARRAGERGRPAGRDPLAVGTRHSSGAPRGDHRAGEPRPGLPGPRRSLLHPADPADDGEADLLAGGRALHRRRSRQHRRPASPHRPAGADRAGARPRRPLPPARQLRRPPRRPADRPRSTRSASTSTCHRAAGSVPWDRLAPLLARKAGAPLLLEVHPPRPSAAHISSRPPSRPSPRRLFRRPPSSRPAFPGPGIASSAPAAPWSLVMPFRVSLPSLRRRRRRPGRPRRGSSFDWVDASRARSSGTRSRPASRMSSPESTSSGPAEQPVCCTTASIRADGLLSGDAQRRLGQAPGRGRRSRQRRSARCRRGCRVRRRS